MARDEDSHNLSDDEPEAAEAEPLPELDEMPTTRPFAHELPQPVDRPPEPASE